MLGLCIICPRNSRPLCSLSPQKDTQTSEKHWNTQVLGRFFFNPLTLCVGYLKRPQSHLNENMLWGPKICPHDSNRPHYAGEHSTFVPRSWFRCKHTHTHTHTHTHRYIYIKKRKVVQ